MGAALTLSGCIGWHRSPVGPQPPHEPRPPAPVSRTAAEASAPLVDLSGAPVGTAKLTEGQGGIAIRLDIDAGKLAPGAYGVRIAESADCTAAAQRSAAQYGLLNVYGAQAGSQPTLTIAADAPAGGDFVIRAATLAPSSRIWTPLIDGNGSAIIVHALAAPTLTAPAAAAPAQAAPAAADGTAEQPARPPELGACAAFGAPAQAPAPAPAAPAQ
jgi:Cu/Zn superoxide dismutase